MKTYTEICGRDPFNWNEFLNKGDWSREELADAYERSSGWVTCAVGNQCSVIPRDGDGKPFDKELQRLGVGFYYFLSSAAISEDPAIEIGKAKKILVKIEERSSKLINENKN